MSRRISEVLVALLVGLVVFFGVLAALLMIRWSPLWDEKAAGWAQAIGSVVAILVTIALFQRQNETIALHALRERRLDMLQRRETAYAMCARAVEMLDEVCEAFFGDADDIVRISEYLDERFSESAFRHMQEALGAIPHHELGSYFLTTGILDLRDAIESCQKLSSEGARFDGCLPWWEKSYSKFAKVRDLRDSGCYAIEEGIEQARKDAAQPL